MKSPSQTKRSEAFVEISAHCHTASTYIRLAQSWTLMSLAPEVSDSMELFDARRESVDNLTSRDGELLDELVSRGGDGSGVDILTRLPGITTGPADGVNIVDRDVSGGSLTGGGGTLVRCEAAAADAARSAADVLQTSRRSCTCASSSLHSIKLQSESGHLSHAPAMATIYDMP